MSAPLLAGAVLGLSVAAPFGPVSLICVQNSLAGGCRRGMVAGLGAATAHGLFATVAVSGAGIAAMFLTPWAGALRLASALVLLVLGVRTLLRARAARPVSAGRGIRASYLAALALALSNPMTILPYLAVATAVAGVGEGEGLLSAWSVPGVVLAVTGWYAGLSSLASLARRHLAGRLGRALNAVAGAMLLGFAAVVGAAGVAAMYP